MAQGTEVGRIYFTLDLDDSKFKRGMAGAETMSGKLGAQAEQLASTVYKTAKRIAIFSGVMVGLGAYLGVKFDAQMETARQGFINLLGSAQKADKTIARIKKEAARTPFEVAGLTAATQLLASVTKDGEKSIDVLLNIGKALAAAGKGQAELDRIILNLQQIGLTGKITEMDIRQFGMNGINILELLADYYGTTKEKASEMVKESKNAFEDLTKAFEKAGTGAGRFANSFTLQAGTFNQLVSNMKDTANQTLGFIFEPLFNSLKKAMSALLEFSNTPAWDSIAKSARDTVGKVAGYLDQITDAFAKGGPEAALNKFKELLNNALSGIDFVTLTTNFINGLLEAIQKMDVSRFAEPLTNVFMNMMATIDWGKVISIIVEQTPKIINGFLEGLIASVIKHPLDWLLILTFLLGAPAGIVAKFLAYLSKIPFVGTLLAFMLEVITSVGRRLTAPIRDWFIRSGKLIMTSVGAGIKDQAAVIWLFIKDILSRAVSRIGEFISPFFNAGKRLILAIVDGVKSAAGAVYDAVKGVLNKARNLLPFSDAKEGPLSDLTKSGKRFSETFASGILRGASAIQNAANRALSLDMANIAGSMVGGAGGGSNSAYNQYGNIYVGSQVQADDFLERLTRSDQLISMGLSG